MLPLRFLTGEFNHPGHQKSTILVVTLAGVSQPYVHVRTEISYPGSRKFGLGGRTKRSRPAVAVLHLLGGRARASSQPPFPARSSPSSTLIRCRVPVG